MLKRILVGIDFSEPNKQVLERASEWAKRLGIPLTAMHVVEHLDPPLFRIYAPMGDPTWFQTFEPNAQKMMDQWLAPYAESKGLIRTGNPAKCLAEQTDADTLLVVGHVGHGALDAIRLGSTAEKVIRQAVGDVLVVRVKTKG